MANVNSVPQGLFGPGILWVTRNDIANQTPTNIGYVNEFSMDVTFSTKELYGQNQFALLVARGTAKCTGKMKAATLSGAALNAVLIGQSWTSGTQYDAFTSTASAIPTGASPAITPTVPSSGTWNQDLGVVDASTLEPFSFVSATAGQPNVSGKYTYSSTAPGKYEFAATDHVKGRSVLISSAYTLSGQAGQSMTMTSQPIGTTPTFQLDYKTTLYGATYYVRLFRCVGSKWADAHKLEDFDMPEYDFSFFSNAQQQVGIISLATQA